jgi:hypothetical protein
MSVDYRIIYIKSNTGLGRVAWIKVGQDSEWLHFITDNGLDRELVITTINDHFRTASIYFISGRKDSIEISLADFENEIERFINSKGRLIWDANFEKAIEFNEIGVMRYGQLRNESQQLLSNLKGDLADTLIEERRTEL